MVTALDVLKEALKNAHENFVNTASDIKDEDIHKDPGGLAHPLGATYAHLIFSEDIITHQMLQGKEPLYLTEWKDKTGASAPMPEMNENYETANRKWSKSVQIDLPKMKEYADAVFKATETFVYSLKDEDLEKEIDLGSWGKKTIHFMLSEYIIGHAFSLTGELSALKGVHGSKGYPF